MNQRSYIIFESVYRNKSFSIASKELGIAQPSISRTIKELENHYGVILFYRDSRNIIPSEQGETLYNKVVNILSLHREMEESINNHRNKATIKVSASITLGKHFFPIYVSQLNKLYPDIEIILTIDENDAVINNVLNKKVCLGFIDKNIINEDLIITNYHHDEIVAICNIENKLSSKDLLSMEEISKYPLLLRTKGNGDRDLIENVLMKKNLPINVAMENDLGVILINAVINNMGIALLPKVIPEYFYNRHITKSIKVKDNELDRDFCFIYRKDTILKEEHYNFINLCISNMNEFINGKIE